MIESIKNLGVSAANNAGELTMTPVRPTSNVAEAQGSDFADLLGGLFSSASTAVKTAEATSIAGIRGKATVQQVVEAVMNAEQSLQGAIAVRDKVVAAYQEISRMQI
jgi:flagellar hook-basal body complex protein FliE